MRTLESLRKEAKRWHAALALGDPAAEARMRSALGSAPTTPTLRDVKFALARELGFSGWSALRDEAERHYRFTWHRRPWHGMREYVQLDLGKRPAVPGGDVDLTLDEARYLVAIEHDFASWDALREATLREPTARIRGPKGMTDEVVASLTRDPSITRFDLAGATGASDASMPYIARMPELRQLDLSGTAITDRGLAFLRELPHLESISLAGRTPRAREVPERERGHRRWAGGTRATASPAAHRGVRARTDGVGARGVPQRCACGDRLELSGHGRRGASHAMHTACARRAYEVRRPCAGGAVAELRGCGFPRCRALPRVVRSRRGRHGR